MKEASNEIWERIKKEKDKKNISDKDFEIELGLNPKTINNWKRGKSSGYMKMLPEIADYFNVSVDYLLGREETVKEEKPAIKMTDFIDKCIEFNITSEDLKKLSKDDWTLIVSIVNNLLKKY